MSGAISPGDRGLGERAAPEDRSSSADEIEGRRRVCFRSRLALKEAAREWDALAAEVMGVKGSAWGVIASGCSSSGTVGISLLIFQGQSIFHSTNGKDGLYFASSFSPSALGSSSFTSSCSSLGASVASTSGTGRAVVPSAPFSGSGVAAAPSPTVSSTFFLLFFSFLPSEPSFFFPPAFSFCFFSCST